jgi:hypothetical protein
MLLSISFSSAPLSSTGAESSCWSTGKQPSVRGPPLSPASARRIVSGEPTTPSRWAHGA